MTLITRRQSLQMLGGASAMTAVGAPVRAFQGAELDVLGLAGPPAPPTLYLSHMMRQPKVKALAKSVKFQQWRSPDMLIAMMTNGQVQVAATPSNTAAILYNKGVKIKLLDITTWGVLHLLTRRNDIKGLPDLRGKKLLSFFRGGMPDIVTQYLGMKQGIDITKEVDVSYASTADVPGRQGRNRGSARACGLGGADQEQDGRSASEQLEPATCLGRGHWPGPYAAGRHSGAIRMG